MKKTNDFNTKITTILGQQCVIDGDFTAEGSTRIDGIINGNVIVKGSLVIGNTGKIVGAIQAEAVSVGGEVIGDIESVGRVEAGPKAKIIGNIKTNLLVVDEHAIFQGRCDMNQDVSEIAKPAGKLNTKLTRAGRKSARAAIAEALKEVDEENKEEDRLEAEKISGLETENKTEPEVVAAEVAKTE